MRTALDDFDGTITIGGRKITNLRYADDIVLVAGSMNELKELTNKVHVASNKSGLHLNPRETKVMKIISGKKCYDDQNLVKDGEDVETVSNFCYLQCSQKVPGTLSDIYKKTIPFVAFQVL